ncbi:MAG: RluA family pseudouridine synthase, partial [Spirochaetota bacterium]
SSLGHPVAGDPIYGRSGGSFKNFSLMLHAYKLTLRLPGESAARVFRAHLPEHFKCALHSLR